MVIGQKWCVRQISNTLSSQLQLVILLVSGGHIRNLLHPFPANVPSSVFLDSWSTPYLSHSQEKVWRQFCDAPAKIAEDNRSPGRRQFRRPELLQFFFCEGHSFFIIIRDPDFYIYGIVSITYAVLHGIPNPATERG